MLLESIFRSQAVNIFKSFGVEVDNLSLAELKQEYKKLAFKLHPDRGGDPENMKKINQAYDILKTKSTNVNDFAWDWSKVKDDPPPKRNYYGKYNFTNIYYIQNWFENKMRFENNKSEYDVAGFDGTYFRCTFTVEGNKHLFEDMAKIMVGWQTQYEGKYPCNAVFIRDKREPEKLLLIYLDGKFLNKNPIAFPINYNYPLNSNKFNDSKFARNLPEHLKYISKNH